MSERPAADPSDRLPAGRPDSTVPPPPPPSEPAAPATTRGKGRRSRREWSIGPPAHLLQRAGDADHGHDPGALAHRHEHEPHHDRPDDDGGAPDDGARRTSSSRDASLLRHLLGS